MKNFETGIQLPRGGGMIQYGDVLTSNCTHDVVVMYHETQKVPIVKVISEKDIWFMLDEFVQSWGGRLNIERNVNVYVA